ncbi:helix-turn-helix domain-containing protein [uncultured Clostridium sp.]|uniref:AlbA family DNA-binding domain-containing protein n=1 Tax=uncultured Clostridium sp. TaxID=59620 RepID=UPI00261F0A1A|nr:RNA-binding domain-containing protein [uncultured Clostridium sp.]
MDRKKLLKLLRQDEGGKLDFKEVLHLKTSSDKKEFVKDVCALANSSGGRAYLVIGIRDKSKQVIGTAIEKLNEERIQQIITSRCDPPIPISVETFQINRKNILVITIFDGEQKPYQVRETGAFYIRRGSITDVMRKGELLNVFQDKLDLNVETCPIVNANEKLLDEILINSYFSFRGIIIDENNRDFLLSSSNIIKIDRADGEKRCTLGSLLVFSKVNSLMIPYNMIKIMGKDRAMEEIIVQGDLLSIIDEASEHIKAILPIEYPYQAIVEAIKNAVLYRDYTLSNCIEVIIGEEEIIVKNPGRFIESSSNYIMNYSKRNMWIYEKLITLDRDGRFTRNGQGFKRMNKMLKSLGHIRVEDSEIDMTVKVIFPGIGALKNIEGVF